VKKKKKDYTTQWAMGIVFALAWFGFIGPLMVSSNSDALVLGYIFVSIAGAVFIIKRTKGRIK
jgi:hypothetical protein